MDLTSRLRSIMRPGGTSSSPRELVYEPDIVGGYQGTLDLDRAGEILGGRVATTAFGTCLVIDRRYEADRFHGDIRIEDCELQDVEELTLLDPTLFGDSDPTADSKQGTANSAQRRTLFIDLETTGLSGGAGTIAFLVGCGYFDLGAFQVRQFLLPSHAAERALLAAVADFFDGADLIVTYNGKTFDLPVMETRWLYHRIEPPLGGVPHFDMLHPARRLWRGRASDDEGSCCRLSTLEHELFDVRRTGDVPGLEIPGRFFRFVRSGDPRPLEPVLEHNRIDLVSLAAITARAAQLARDGHGACRDGAEALSLGRVYERAEQGSRAEGCYRHAAASTCVEVKAEALYRLGVRYRRDRKFEDAASVWEALLALSDAQPPRGRRALSDLRTCAAEALAVHMEHRRRDLRAAREHALFALEQCELGRADGVRHRLARIDRKIGAQAKKNDAQLFTS